MVASIAERADRRLRDASEMRAMRCRRHNVRIGHSDVQHLAECYWHSVSASESAWQSDSLTLPRTGREPPSPDGPITALDCTLPCAHLDPVALSSTRDRRGSTRARRGGIPIGSVLVIVGGVGRGHNRRVQRGAPCSTPRWLPRTPAPARRRLSAGDALLHALALRHVQRCRAPLRHSSRRHRREPHLLRARGVPRGSRGGGDHRRRPAVRAAHARFHRRATRPLERGHRRLEIER